MEKLEKFRILGLSNEALIALKKKGFEEPSPIQEKVIPLLLEGNIDIIGQAQTGTGKTAAFGLPIIENLKSKGKNVRALVLTPTRELAIQVAEEMASFKGKKKLKILPVYGGQAIEMQLRHLKKGVNIVVGTPGRILDHLRRGSLVLDNLDYCVLDEADEILNMGFLEDIHEILKHTNNDKRTLLFSATMPREILKIAKTYMGPYELIKIQDKQMTVAQTEQIYFQVSESDKFEALCRIIDFEPEFYGLVFCRTKIDADRISHRLLDRGYDVDTLHGDLSQALREKVMNRFRRHKINILVATDVAARGIDVNDLTHVINFSIPQDPESYVHRIGRTGRAGKTGTAITFITPSEEKKLIFIEQRTKSKIQKKRVPRIRDIIQAKKEKIRAELSQIDYSELNRDYLLMANELLENNPPEMVLAALLKQAYQEELDPENYNEIRDGLPKIPGRTRLFVAKGKKDGMTPQKLIRFVATDIKIKPKRISDVFIQEDFSFITVPLKEAEMILKYFRKRKNGKRSIVEKAVPRV